MTPTSQVTHIRNFLQRVHSPGDLIEIRGLGSEQHGTMRLLTDDFTLAAKAAVKMSTLGSDVYYTLNPVDPASHYARRATINYPFCHVHETAGDRGILHRNLYLIDIDPIRESRSATAEQRAAALETANSVRQYLSDRSWSLPIAILDSGNGVHLLYRGDDCSADGSILRYALTALANRFNDSCKIDTAVCNASRISRLPFTTNTKAERLSTILDYPVNSGPVPAAKVYALALDGGYKTDYDLPRAPSTCTLAIDEEGVRRLITEYPSILHLDRVTQQGDRTFFSLSSCPFKGTPHRNSGVGAGKTSLILGPDFLGFNCFSGDCEGLTIGDLLRLLHGKTGRWPSMSIWEDDLEELEARWPEGIDDVALEPDPVEDYLRFCYEEGLWNCLPEGVAEKFHAAGCWNRLTTEPIPSPDYANDPVLLRLMMENVAAAQREREES